MPPVSLIQEPYFQLVNTRKKKILQTDKCMKMPGWFIEYSKRRRRIDIERGIILETLHDKRALFAENWT
jgi:hypothetical protein